jgi:hypothetical protein
MTKARPRQLELPVMVDVNGSKTQGAASHGRPEVLSPSHIDHGFHKPASADDQSVYKAISDSYFRVAVKQA